MIGIIVLLLVCAFFTACEMAAVSADPLKLRYWADKKIRGAKFALNTIYKQDRLIMTTLIGINLSVISLSVVTTRVWYSWSEKPKLPGWHGVGLAFIIAIFIFIFAEILPKTLVLRAKEKFFLVFAAKFLTTIYWIFSPIIFLTYQISLKILKILKAPHTEKMPAWTKEEIRLAGRRALSIKEQSFVARLFEFKNKYAKHIMIPKELICATNINLEIQEIKELISKNKFSRIPVFNTTIDDIVGYIYARDLLTVKPNTTKLPENIIRQCKFILETTPVSVLFDEIRDKESYFVIVKSNDNKTVGVITMEDVIEELFGEIEDEYDM